MTAEPVEAVLASLDWVLECKNPKCRKAATHWVEFHHVRACHHPALSVDGNACGYVCGDHLEGLRRRALHMVRYFNPPFWLSWLTSRKPFCPSCGRPVQTVGDVLQEEKPLWQ